MNNRTRLIRKAIYGVGIVVVVMLVSKLASPGVVNESGQLIRGGTLAQIRHENKLSQANLGEIDPASETMKLATLGLRGIAVNLLWGRANDYKMKEDWTSLSATLEQIRRLVPNFISVWQFQAWNLTYNVSVEFDDFRDRYRWVMRGINYLKEGTRYNANNPPLLWDMGWTISQKIGRADEHVQFRKLFKDDDDFHGPRPRAKRDNWLVGQEWFQEAEHVVDDLGVPISGLNPLYDTGLKRGKSPLIFYSDSAMCQINYADAMEEEGTFGEVAKDAWKKAGEMWTNFGKRDLATTYNVSIRLNDKESNDDRAAEALAELKKMLPEDTEQKIRDEKIAKLTNREKIALNMPAEKRNAEQQTMMYNVDEKIKVTPADLANRVQGAERPKALELADRTLDLQNRADIIDRYRDIVNFAYWRGRCALEQTDNALQGRKALLEAEVEFNEKSRPSESIKLYELGFEKWRAVLDEFPNMLKENTITEDLVDYIKQYRKNLDQLERKFPEPFILQDVLDMQRDRLGEPTPVDQKEAADAAIEAAQEKAKAAEEKAKADEEKAKAATEKSE